LGPPTAVGRLWVGLLAPPTAWVLQLLVSYPLAQLSCQAGKGHQHLLTMQVIALGALLVIGYGAVTAWHALRSAHDASSDGGRSIDRARFMAGLGVLTAMLFTVLVIATAIPTWILHACQ
jgi:fumarate reductase subunit D